MKKILNYFGLFTLKQYTTLLKENVELEDKINKCPYEFQELLKNYNPNQLNALFYQAVNVCYNKDTFRYLLERWFIRLKGLQQPN